MTRRLMIFSILLSTLTVHEPVAGATEVWHTSTIKWIYPHGQGRVVLTFNDSAPTCTHVSSFHLIEIGVNGVTEVGFRNMYAAALAAAAGGQTVSIKFDDTASLCVINSLYVRYSP